ncbi:MAG: DUF3786 domain-containing protein [Desulfobacterales bacterium]|jgi:hypothetical protein|nr:DUF3786 domain-containing protein [Desulfobacterales bacterium]
MRKEDRQQPSSEYAPDGSHLQVADHFWQQVEGLDLLLAAARTQFDPADGGLVFRFLDREVRVDPGARRLRRQTDGRWEALEDPLLELSVVLYLITVQDLFPLGREIVGPNDLKEGHFFRGPHEFKTAALLDRFGNDLKSFRQAAAALGGEPVEMADAAFRLKPFPRVHLYYLLWEGDEEFPPRVSILMERSIEKVLPADAIWALVNRVSAELLRAA